MINKINSTLAHLPVIDLNNYMYNGETVVSDGSKNILGTSITEQSYFLDESDRFPIGAWHPNEAGNKKIAELISDVILKD